MWFPIRDHGLSALCSDTLRINDEVGGASMIAQIGAGSVQLQGVYVEGQAPVLEYL